MFSQKKPKEKTIYDYFISLFEPLGFKCSDALPLSIKLEATFVRWIPKESREDIIIFDKQNPTSMDGIFDTKDLQAVILARETIDEYYEIKMSEELNI